MKGSSISVRELPEQEDDYPEHTEKTLLSHCLFDLGEAIELRKLLSWHQKKATRMSIFPVVGGEEFPNFQHPKYMVTLPSTGIQIP